jgi:hypothetical protein
MFEYKKQNYKNYKYEVYYKDYYLCSVPKKSNKITLSVKGNRKLQNICKKLQIGIGVDEEWNGYGYSTIDKYISNKRNIKKSI